MYIGFIPVPDRIRKLLENSYSVNWEFISLGNKVPIFKNPNIEDSDIEFLYYKNESIQNVLNRFENLDFEKTLKISIPKINVDFFIDIFGDNIFPTFSGKEIIGIKRIPFENINFGLLYLIQLDNSECILRRIFQRTSNKNFLIKKEDANFPEVIIEAKNIKSLYKVNTVINAQFY
jgi:hypothetical protein